MRYLFLSVLSGGSSGCNCVLIHGPLSPLNPYHPQKSNSLLLSMVTETKTSTLLILQCYFLIYWIGTMLVPKGNPDEIPFRATTKSNDNVSISSERRPYAVERYVYTNVDTICECFLPVGVFKYWQFVLTSQLLWWLRNYLVRFVASKPIFTL